MKHNKKGGKGISLLVKLSGISTFFILLAIVIFSVISVTSVQTSGIETATVMGEEKLIGDMKYFERLIFDKYGQLSLTNGKLVGEQGVSLQYEYELVDQLSYETGVAATVFVKEGNGYRRISTSIIDGAEKRVVDTFLDSNSAAYPSVTAGADYCGNAVILGSDYLTLYRPVLALNEREVIGILFIGIEMSKVKNIISQNSIDHVIEIIIIAIVILLALIVANMLSLNLILVKPIRTVTAIIRRLSMGDLNVQIGENKNRDEIWTMKNELTHLFDGLKQTACFAQNIGKGDLNAQYQPLSSDDVLGNSLLDMRQSLLNAEKTQAINAKNEKQRNWVTEGIAKFSDILHRDNTNMETFSYNIIKNMVKYLDANQGGIFVVNDNDGESEKLLELKGCYAYDRKKFEKKQISPGEGLIGACYLEGKPIYMTDIPDDYINITSGLGDANPKVLLINPLTVNDEIFGVIELAAFEKFEKHQIEFVQKVSESIAATISTVKVNLRTAHLLERAKLQAEELANAEEELRQSMEEMQATQEEMRRREIELQEIIARYESTTNL